MSQTQAQPSSAAAAAASSNANQQPAQGQRQPMNKGYNQNLPGGQQDMILMQQMAQQSQTRQNSTQDGTGPKPKEKLPSVYIGNLPKDFYQLDLYKHVKGLGYNIFQAVINADKKTNK